MSLTKEEVLKKIVNGESFEGVEIGDIDFSSQIFTVPVDLSGAKFLGHANFNSVVFKNKAEFNATSFNGMANFEKTKFEIETSFYYAIFNKTVNFSSAIFNNVNFSFATFINAKFFSTSFRNATFFGSIFEGETYFSKAIFEGEAYFYSSHFNGIVFFNNSNFKNIANFTRAKFKNQTSFASSIFNQKTIFNSSVFDKKADFSKIAFYNDTHFFYVIFNNIADFYLAIFFKTVHFENAKFIGATSFSNTVFEERSYFIGNIEKETKNLCFYNIVDWSYARFLKPKLIDFTSVDFSKCRLSFADFSSVNLVDIKWQEKNNRKVISDEIEDKKSINYSIVENAYRRLKKNYENSGDYSYAGDFHIGEMEMKRLAQIKFFRYLSLTSLYKYLSGYGEKFWRSIIWLIGFIFIFSYISLFTGLKSNNISLENNMTDKVKYSFTLDYREVSLKELPNDFCTALTHSFEVIVLKRDKLFESNTNTGRILEFFQIISVTILATLSILSLKRKFHR